MSYRVLARRASGVCLALAALAAAAPGAALASRGCTPPTLTQPFLSFGDPNWYAIAPGERYDSFAGTGWTLSGGATIVSTTLFDGTKGLVLDLPSGASAVSPAMCVTNDYPTARSMVRNISGWAGVNVFVSYTQGDGWTPPESTGALRSFGTSWWLSGTLYIHPGNVSGWQLARFTFVGGGSGGESQLYNFYVDPRMH